MPPTASIHREHQRTFAGDVSIHDPPGAQPHTGGFPLCRIRLLGLGEADFETDAFHCWVVDQRGRDGLSRFLGDAASAADLRDGGVGCASGVEGVCGAWGQSGSGLGSADLGGAVEVAEGE